MRAWPLLLLLLPTVLASIDGEVTIGHARHLITPSGNLSVWFIGHDALTGRSTIRLNDRVYHLLPLQSAVLPPFTFTFTFLGAGGETAKDMQASFVVTGADAFTCVQRCEDTPFVDFMRVFDRDFSLCYQDCQTGCDQYREAVCDHGKGLVIDSCARTVDELPSCPLTRCVGCDTGFACMDGEECAATKRCVLGQCEAAPYREGDRVCDLPAESCASSDCSCGTDVPEMTRSKSPVILLHGFASSPVRLRKLQRAMVSRLGLEYGGEISIFDAECETHSKDAVFLATYYANQDKGNIEEGALRDFIITSYTRIGGFEETKEPDFLLTMEKVVDKVRSCTDSDQVTVIAHSMGGLVVRNYMLDEGHGRFLDKLILLGTPTKGGIYGSQTYRLIRGLEAPLGDRRQLLRDCADIGIPSIALTLLDGRDYSGDCQALATAGQRVNQVFSIDETPGRTEYYTVAGNIDGVGDGMVEMSGVQLQGAVTNAVVPCNHFDLKHPSRCQEALIAIAEALGMDESEVKNPSIAQMFGEGFLSLRDLIAEFLS